MRELVIDIDYGLGLILLACLFYYFFSKKIKKSPADFLIFQILLFYIVISSFNGILQYFPPYPLNNFFLYRLVFPTFVIFQVVVRKKTWLITGIGLIIFAVATFLLDSNQVKEMMHEEFRYAFILPALATIALFYKTMEGVRNPHFHHYYLILLAGLMTCDMFFSAVWSKIIQFDMETWLTFITSFAIFVGFMYLTALYYFIRKYVLR